MSRLTEAAAALLVADDMEEYLVPLDEDTIHRIHSASLALVTRLRNRQKSQREEENFHV